MARRSTSQSEIDDRAFPVRMMIFVPQEGFGALLGAGPETIDTWLQREVGTADFAKHTGGRGHFVPDRYRVALYFRHPLAAARFLDAFPQLELADGTTAPVYSSPALPFGRS